MSKKQIVIISVIILIVIIILGIMINKNQKRIDEENNKVNENITTIDDSEIFQKKERDKTDRLETMKMGE